MLEELPHRLRNVWLRLETITRLLLVPPNNSLNLPARHARARSLRQSAALRFGSLSTAVQFHGQNARALTPRRRLAQVRYVSQIKTSP